MAERDLTDEQLAAQNIFGVEAAEPEKEPEQEIEKEPEAEPEPEADPETESEKEPEAVKEPESEPDKEPEEEPEKEPEVDFSKISDDKFIELVNSKFNREFETIEQANDFIGTQVQYRGQEEIIAKLVDKLKESSNVLSHFPDEQSYKVAQLAKTKYPKKEEILSKVLRSDVSAMSDFDAIRLAEQLKRPVNGRGDVLDITMAKLGLRDLDISEFNDWDERDKSLIYGVADEAKEFLSTVGNDIEVPKDGDAGIKDFVSQIESGFQERQKQIEQLTETYKPVAESLVNETIKIKPVEGSDFEYEVKLDDESKADLMEFLTAEAIEGEYNIKSDADIRRLTGMLHSEIWATDGPKIMNAYGEYREKQAWDAARAKYENAKPLDDAVPESKPGDTEITDDDRAKAILGG